MTRLTKPSEPQKAREQELAADAKSCLGAGVGLGAFGVVSGALLGAVCPLCIVATPALIGAGLYKHLCARRERQLHAGEPTTTDSEAALGRHASR